MVKMEEDSPIIKNIDDKFQELLSELVKNMNKSKVLESNGNEGERLSNIEDYMALIEEEEMVSGIRKPVIIHEERDLHEKIENNREKLSQENIEPPSLVYETIYDNSDEPEFQDCYEEIPADLAPTKVPEVHYTAQELDKHPRVKENIQRSKPYETSSIISLKFPKSEKNKKCTFITDDKDENIKFSMYTSSQQSKMKKKKRQPRKDLSKQTIISVVSSQKLNETKSKQSLSSLSMKTKKRSSKKGVPQRPLGMNWVMFNRNNAWKAKQGQKNKTKEKKNLKKKTEEKQTEKNTEERQAAKKVIFEKENVPLNNFAHKNQEPDGIKVPMNNLSEMKKESNDKKIVQEKKKVEPDKTEKKRQWEQKKREEKNDEVYLDSRQVKCPSEKLFLGDEEPSREIEELIGRMPFVVGRSISKSYHLGLSFQEAVSMLRRVTNKECLVGPTAEGMGLAACLSRQGSRGDTAGHCEALSWWPEEGEDEEDNPWDMERARRRPACSCLPQGSVTLRKVLRELSLRADQPPPAPRQLSSISKVSLSREGLKKKQAGSELLRNIRSIQLLLTTSNA